LVHPLNIRDSVDIRNVNRSRVPEIRKESPYHSASEPGCSRKLPRAKSKLYAATTARIQRERRIRMEVKPLL